jgi:4-hydroxybenzoate polyprenyltransferase
MSKAEAMRLYQIVTGVGIVCGLASAFYLRSITLGMIYVIVPGMLWFYSSSYKRQLIVGNLIVALSAGLVPLVPMFVEASSLSNKYGELLSQTPILRTLYGWVCAFALFSFLFTFIREAIKDLQDEPGDREYECHTMAVVWGETITRIVLTALIILTNAILAYFVYALIPFEGTLSSRYFLFGIAAPSVCLIAILWSKSCTAYANASSLCKFIMLIGTLYALIYHYLLAATYHIPMFGIFQIMQ